MIVEWEIHVIVKLTLLYIT